MSTRKIVSGGQTGVDRAALEAAVACGLEIGGWCPPGRASEAGPIPSRFPLLETPRDRSPRAPTIPRSQRTEWNVRDSDATLVLRPAADTAADPGTEWALSTAARLGRPAITVDPWSPGAADQIRDWLARLEIETLAVGGPSEATVPGIGARVRGLLLEVLADRGATAGESGDA